MRIPNLLLPLSLAASAAAYTQGSFDPCVDGIVQLADGTYTQIYCNKKISQLLQRHHTQDTTREACAASCNNYGIKHMKQCCGALYNGRFCRLGLRDYVDQCPYQSTADQRSILGGGNFRSDVYTPVCEVDGMSTGAMYCPEDPPPQV